MSENTKWIDHIDKLKKTGKIEKAALIDFNGNILACSPGLPICQKDINAILRALESQYSSLVKLTVGSNVFTCFRNDSCTNSLIGRADHDVLAVYRCVDFVVIAFSDPESPGSSIYEMTKFVKRIYRQSGKVTELNADNAANS